MRTVEYIDELLATRIVAEYERQVRKNGTTEAVAKDSGWETFCEVSDIAREQFGHADLTDAEEKHLRVALEDLQSRLAKAEGGVWILVYAGGGSVSHLEVFDKRPSNFPSDDWWDPQTGIHPQLFLGNVNGGDSVQIH